MSKHKVIYQTTIKGILQIQTKPAKQYEQKHSIEGTQIIFLTVLVFPWNLTMLLLKIWLQKQQTTSSKSISKLSKKIIKPI